ncbi:transporter substrate-binding domain-containing protein [Terasakiella sp. A23]|uniref:substrate-binding periplasmic protein n=1 Tax=Terasakiella sp. FCG-A23 TaxID=3080561 RepID=UPI002954A60C|nr:transporter substrate-binding domain-containing protein [Terasakiella sp. A23]MDV7339177.1 transporter substrate-binding domain-containing protein [Terasakiella sp. A23]
MMIRSLFYVGSVVCFILTMAFSARAETITLKAATLHFPPYSYAVKKHQVDGLSVALVRHIARQAGVRVNIEVYPWSRALYLARKGNVDMLFTAYKTLEREAYLDYGAEPLLMQEVSLFVAQESSFSTISSLLEKRHIQISKRRGFSYGSTIDGIFGRGAVQKQFIGNDDEQLVEMLAEGKVDAVPLNRIVARFYQRKGYGIRDLRNSRSPVETVASYLTFSKKSKHRDVLKTFDAILIKMKKSGQYQTFIEDWLMRVK